MTTMSLHLRVKRSNARLALDPSLVLSFCPQIFRANPSVHTGDNFAQLGNAIEALAIRVVYVIGECMVATGERLVRCQLVFMNTILRSHPAVEVEWVPRWNEPHVTFTPYQHIPYFLYTIFGARG